MTEATTTPESTPESTPAPAGAAAYTDEQLAEAFPGQDIGHIKSMLNKSAGVGVPTDPNADGETPNAQKPDAAKADDADSNDAADTVEYPAWIPEKFRQGTVEEAMQKLAESYSVIERARGTADTVDGGDNADAAGDGNDPAAQDAPAHVDLRDLEAKFVENGNKITEEMYAEAEKAGMGREVLDQFIAGQQAIANAMISKVHGTVGGPKNYDSMLEWMIGNMSPAEVEAYDAAMATGREATIMLAVRGLKASYEQAMGSDPGRRVAPATGNVNEVGFQSKREMIDAMKDPRYQKDEAYRQMVARKIHAGNVW